MPPQYRRYAPLILIALVLLVLLPLLKRSNSGSSLSDKDRATMTLDAMHRIDSGELAFKQRTGRYTSHLADLVTKDLAADLAIGMSVQLDASSDGKSYLAQVESVVLSLVRHRSGPRLVADSCLRLKSSVKCPSPAPK